MQGPFGRIAGRCWIRGTKHEQGVYHQSFRYRRVCFRLGLHLYHLYLPPNGGGVITGIW